MTSHQDLEQLVLESHVVLRLEPNTSTEDVDQSTALLRKSVDDWSSRWGQWGLQHEAQDREDGVEVLEVLGGGTIGGCCLPLNAGEHLRQDDQINDQRRGQERVLANIEQTVMVSMCLHQWWRGNLRDGLVAAHEDLGVVLIQGTLVVANGRHVLDDDGVIRVLALLVEDVVGSDHVIHDVGLGDFLGAELLVRAEVLAIVVAKMIVAGNGGELDASRDQEVDQGRLHLGLARLEVVSANEGVVLLSELDAARDERVLWRAVDERSILEDASNSEDGGWGNFLVSILNGLQEVVRSVVDTFNQLGETLGVGSPEDDDLVQAVVGLEVTDGTLAMTF